MGKIKVIFLVPYPLKEAPSQRFRFEQYFDVLEKNQIDYRVSSFIDEKTWKILYKPGYYFQKTLGILLGFLRRKWVLLSIPFYDFVFIHREASPIGLPFLEFFISKIFRKRIIYDFDDAIWLENTSDTNKIAGSFKCHWKVKYICSWAYKVSCGNAYLADYAKQFNTNVVINPTTIDTEHLHNRSIDYKNGKSVIGWTGTHSTIGYLDAIVPILRELEEELEFAFIVISNRAPLFELKSLQFIPWNKETEIEDLLKMNIGIMPLEDDIWAKGKCGFKGLQYMSLGIATIMSPVGVNVEIIQERVNGLLASTREEWKDCLRELIIDIPLRNKLGAEGQKTIEARYSVKSNRQRFLELFR
ncbi:MAG: glycosyltransferase family 4 protein [Chitinophagales bacterium]|nr:glycosyltransferase family 4 protein [Chitinophagales bacterium]